MVSYKTEEEIAMFGIEMKVLVGFASELFVDPWIVVVSFFYAFSVIACWHLGKIVPSKPESLDDYFL